MTTLPTSSARLGDVAVLGLGVSGKALIAYLAEARRRGRVGRIAAFGRADEASVAALRARYGCEVDVICEERVSGSFDLAIASPGISVFSEFFASAEEASVEVVGEPEFAYRESPERWLAVTGTNGKTTTTTLLAELMRGAGFGALALGNIGDTLIEAVAKRADEWFCTELSSYQLATTRRLHPRAAILLNVTPDHLAWHRTLEHYEASKMRAFANLDAKDLAILVTDDAACAREAEALCERGLRVCRVSAAGRPLGADAAWVSDGRLTVELGGETFDLGAAADLQIKGAHNATNALAAATAALFAGADAASVAGTLAAFRPLEHRVEPVPSADGISYIDDSKATNTDAVEKALGAVPAGRTIILLGGTDKGTDLTSLAAAVAATCKAAVCYGEAGERIRAALEAAGAPGIVSAGHLADAFDRARELARKGDTILLSPACASFDEFSGFEERGERFRALVAEKAGRP